MNALAKEGSSPSSNDKICQMWADLMIQIPQATTKWTSLKSPDNNIIKIFYEIAIHKWTEIVILGLTFLNLVVLAIDHEGPNPDFEFISGIINNTTTGMFILEAIVKLIGLGTQGYFESSWNRFDFFIVVSSIVDILFVIIMTNSNETNPNSIKFLKTFQILRILRMIRVTR